MTTLIVRMQRGVVRCLLVCGLAFILATTFVVVQEPTPVIASPDAASMQRTDRRPDRERPTTPPKGSTQSGDSQGQSSSGQRPKLVRK